MSNSAGSAKVTQVSSRPLETASFRVQSEFYLDMFSGLCWTQSCIWRLQPRCDFTPRSCPVLRQHHLEQLHSQRCNHWDWNVTAPEGMLEHFCTQKKIRCVGILKLDFPPYPGRAHSKLPNYFLFFVPHHLKLKRWILKSTWLLTVEKRGPPKYSPISGHPTSHASETSASKLRGRGWTDELGRVRHLRHRVSRIDVFSWEETPYAIISMYRMHPKSYANCIHINNPQKNWETRSQVMH